MKQKRIKEPKEKMTMVRFKQELPLFLMLLPPVILVLIFSYGCMAGIALAFMDYIPGSGWYIFGSEWVGLRNFELLLSRSDIWRVFWNTLSISGMKIICGLAFSVLVALLLNELKWQGLKKGIQAAGFLPYFISWVTIAGMMVDILSPDTGIVFNFLESLGLNPPIFLADNNWFQPILVISNVWKESGYNIVIFIAAITSIDPSLYEAARIDGANRIQQTRHVTLPGIMPVIVVVLVLAMGSILSTGFEQVYNLYSPIVYKSGDILDTYVYRLGIDQGQYSLSVAVGLLKSVVSLILVSVSYYAAYKFADYRLF